MKSINQFLRDTLTGGILFLLPVVIIIMVLKKAHDILLKISAPLANVMPDILFGLDGSNVLAVLLLILFCFIGGMLFRFMSIRKLLGKIETNVFSYLPGYAMIKSITADALGATEQGGLHPVMVEDGDSFKIGFKVEEFEGMCTIFFPEAPKHDSGEVKIVPVARVKMLKVQTHVVTKSLKNYGKGALQWKS